MRQRVAGVLHPTRDGLSKAYTWGHKGEPLLTTNGSNAWATAQKLEAVPVQEGDRMQKCRVYPSLAVAHPPDCSDLVWVSVGFVIDHLLDRSRYQQQCCCGESPPPDIPSLACEDSMGKKRERSVASSAATETGPDPSTAEPLLFQLVDNDGCNSVGSANVSRKRSKVARSEDDSDAPLAAAAEAEDGPNEEDEVDKKRKHGHHHPEAIAPSSTLRQCNGFDIVRKGSRGRGRQLMVLPGSLGLGSGGSGPSGAARLGTLKHGTSGCPVLYVEFAEGRLKCTGRKVHTKGRFFTLYADKAASRATRMDCRDVFDSVVFFSKACWIGRAEENPEEEPLPLPESLESLPDEIAADGSGEESIRPFRTNNYKTHFGGGNPEHPLSGATPKRDADGKAFVSRSDDPDMQGQADAEAGMGDEGLKAADGAAGTATPSRRSSRSTKSTATYVEDSDESGGEINADGSSSSSSEEGDTKGPGLAAVGAATAGATLALGKGEQTKENGGGGGGGEGGSNSGSDDVEVFTILNAPTAKRKPVTVGSGREANGGAAAAAASGGKRKAATQTKKAVSAVTNGRASVANRKRLSNAGAKEKGRRSSPASAGSSDDDSDGPTDNAGVHAGGSDVSGEDTPASEEEWGGGGEVVDAAPSRRSRRSSAATRVKYTQSSGSEEDDGDEGGEGDDKMEDDDSDE